MVYELSTLPKINQSRQINGVYIFDVRKFSQYSKEYIWEDWMNVHFIKTEPSTVNIEIILDIVCF